MQPKYKAIIKQIDGTFFTKEVAALTFLTVNGLQQIGISYTLETKDKVTEVVDESTVWLFQSTNTFDKKNISIYHGDLLKDAEGILFEVMYACGSYFIVKDDAPLMLLDEYTRNLEVVGNVVENFDLIKVDASILNK